MVAILLTKASWLDEPLYRLIVLYVLMEKGGRVVAKSMLVEYLAVISFLSAFFAI
jgi:hypothetical protein